METTGDMELLQEYVTNGSEAAFGALVSRHVNLVYSVAWRHTGNPHAAEEITHAVFIILARKAGSLRRGTVLSGWLFHTARLTAANHVRGEIRRNRREQEAYMRSNLPDTGNEDWQQMSPLLDEAIASLGKADRNAIVMRFMEGKELKEVGAAIGATSDGARMRLGRALEKLRAFFAKRGLKLSVAVIASGLAANAVQAAPTGLVSSATAAAVAQGSAAIAAGALANATLKVMAWMKLKSAVAAGVGTLLVAGTATVTVGVITHSASGGGNAAVTEPVVAAAPVPPSTNALENSVVWSRDPQILAQQPLLAVMRLSPAPRAGGLGTGDISMSTATGPRKMTTGVTLTNVVTYILNLDQAAMNRVILPPDQTQTRYDFIDTLPRGGRGALQKQLKDQFGLVVRREIRTVDVLLLRLRRSNAPGLQASPNARGGGGKRGRTGMSANGATMAFLAGELEAVFALPVIDQTRLTGKINYDLSYRDGASLDEIKQAVLSQLGLELVPAPAKQPVAYFIVEKAD